MCNAFYDRFGLAFTDAHGARIERFRAESASAARLGRHKHSPAEYGIDPDEVHERLADYYERFGRYLTPAGKD